MSGWTMREAAEVLMSGRKAANRSGCKFELDDQRMAMAGFLPREVEEIVKAVNEIEEFTEARLACLRRR